MNEEKIDFLKKAGSELNAILENIENTLWSMEANIPGFRPEYSDEGFRASMKIFMSALMSRMWELQEAENMSMEDRAVMAHKAGEQIRLLVKTYTDIDTHDLYKK